MSSVNKLNRDEPNSHAMMMLMDISVKLNEDLIEHMNSKMKLFEGTMPHDDLASAGTNAAMNFSFDVFSHAKEHTDDATFLELKKVFISFIEDW